ncbi:SDR family oxidoreductase (plasmid) [Rhodococcus pseudokoreensis]|uniref:3-oxoacyl-[acyl-carrier-protein] reductase MabA n=1 Tax=Rhodococcus pseudokoreensis TaxID=2811421 RepID=A0A974VY77_9NOCA|nr:SDR family oxidoreductase [Rhodococcus pseudokoreensis]QSE87436.1 SDR family oxidoreductase [Rhodococcus pseudokoreensis]
MTTTTERRQVAVVTGAATGIGFGITQRLLDDGITVVMAGLDVELLEKARARLGVLNRTDTFAGDLSAPGVSEAMIESARTHFGRIDILVNNAGGGLIAPTLEHTEETLQATIDRNLWTTLRSTLAVLPSMVNQGYGRIVNIGAESVRNGLTDHAVYNAAKGGVHALATGLAREFARHGITVNVVAPSYTRTDEIDAAIAGGRIGPRFRKVLDDATCLIPMGRGAEVDEIAAAVAFLAREDSRFITGQIISVNGGSSMS